MVGTDGIKNRIQRYYRRLLYTRCYGISQGAFLSYITVLNEVDKMWQGVVV